MLGNYCQTELTDKIEGWGGEWEKQIESVLSLDVG